MSKDLKVDSLMKIVIGTRLIRKEVQLASPKATPKAPTNIRKMDPGPRTVPTIMKI